MGQIIFEEIGNPSCTQVINFQDIGAQGIPGESAYQYAIRTGMFVGTEVEFYDRVVNEPIAAANAANQAAENANTAASNVGDAVATALASAGSADLAAQNANQAIENTVFATSQAVLATQDAAQAVTYANDATYNANQAASNANTKAAEANAAKDATIVATAAANLAASKAVKSILTGEPAGVEVIGNFVGMTEAAYAAAKNNSTLVATTFYFIKNVV